MRQAKFLRLCIFIVIACGLGNSLAIFGVKTGYFFVAIAAIHTYLATTWRLPVSLRSSNNFGQERRIPVYFLILWIYGFSLGLFFGNEPDYVIRNFFGMNLYVVFYILMFSGVQFSLIYKDLMFAGRLVLFLSIFGYFVVQLYDFRDLFISNIIYGNPKTYASDGGVKFFSVLQLIVFPFFADTAFSLIGAKKFRNKNRFVINILYFLLVLFMVLVISDSKAFYLVTMFILAAALLTNFKPNVRYLFVFLFVSILFLIMTQNERLVLLLSDGTDTIFGESSRGNIVRYGAIQEIYNELNWMGHGLGAAFSSYSRNDDFPYATEVVYLNLLHKYGFVSVFIFGFYILTVLLLMSKSIAREGAKYIPGITGCLSFLIYSIGNPYLFSVQSVIMHCIILYFIYCCRLQSALKSSATYKAALGQ